VADLSGELIDGRYELLRQIATGGMATIYEGLDTRLDRKVAVKIMHSHLANDEEFVNRFIREAKAAAALTHPNIVAVQDQGWNQSGVPAVFLVMELIEGHTLRDYLFERGKLSQEETLRYLIPVLSALAAAHKVGIVHRDIKPENILISSSGFVKIADFGLATGDLIGRTLTTESSVILGSVSYLPPEQVQRGVTDSRSDVYSVGIVAYELLTGEKPFEGQTPIEIAYKHVNEKVPTPSMVVKGINPLVDALVARATSLNPDDRPRDAGQFLDEMRDVLAVLDPKRTQMSLELDLPVMPVRDKSRKGSRVSTGKTPPISGTVLTMPAAKESVRAKKKRASARVQRNRWVALLIVIALCAGGWYLLVGPGVRIVVPSVAGMSVAEANQALEPLGLKSVVGEEVFSEDIPKGKIISSKPGGGGKVKAAGTVSFTLSKGPERYLVPDVHGITPDAATALIMKSPLKIGNVTTSFSSDVPDGIVISTTPAVGTSVTRDSTIDILVSKGIELVVMSSYVGKSGEQALNELTDAGFDVTSDFAFSDTIATGAVISQTPDVATAGKGTKVVLVVSKGSESVFIPNIYSLTQSKATSALQDLDLKVMVKKIGKAKIKSVTNISPKVGTKVKRGSTVTITVG